jgi:hypothetical protein
MYNNNLYPISQAFSKYPNLSAQWLLLGNIPYQTNILSVCQLNISKDEFLNYLSTTPEFVCIIITCDNDSLQAISHMYLPKINKYTTVLNETFHTNKKSIDNSEERIIDFPKKYTKEQLIKQYKNNNIRPFSILQIAKSFRDSECNILFDVYTTYNILSMRSYCVNNINNYSKQVTLQQFNEILDDFLGNNFRSYNFYIVMNCESLDISWDKLYGELEMDIRDKILSL